MQPMELMATLAAIRLFWRSRDALVDFLLAQLDSDTWLHRAPALGNG